MKKILFCIIMLVSFISKGQIEELDISISPLIDGTLVQPQNEENTPLAILIQGSGPIDRNGNGFM
ncbi:MAG TPA: hypothetical protein VK833_04875, partial [Gillisia sp.]|nr:hypothetical protein [Gillisia sp.]